MSRPACVAGKGKAQIGLGACGGFPRSCDASSELIGKVHLPETFSCRIQAFRLGSPVTDPWGRCTICEDPVRQRNLQDHGRLRIGCNSGDVKK